MRVLSTQVVRTAGPLPKNYKPPSDLLGDIQLRFEDGADVLEVQLLRPVQSGRRCSGTPKLHELDTSFTFYFPGTY